MAPRTTSWFQERPWDAPTKGLAWFNEVSLDLPVPGSAGETESFRYENRSGGGVHVGHLPTSLSWWIQSPDTTSRGISIFWHTPVVQLEEHHLSMSCLCHESATPGAFRKVMHLLALPDLIWSPQNVKMRRSEVDCPVVWYKLRPGSKAFGGRISFNSAVGLSEHAQS